MKTASPRYLARIWRIALVLGGILAPAMVPNVPLAHDGAHLTRIVSDVEAVAIAGSRVNLSFAISNYSEDEVVLQSVKTPGADTTAIAPVLIAPGAQQNVDVTLFFQTPIPRIFTAVLDFGMDGQGPVLVMN